MGDSGVYTIVNKTNGHRYVGSAVNLKGRVSAHRSNLNKKKHCNGYLQNAWNKYGEDVFEFQVFFYCGPKMCEPLEQMAMDVIGPEYNIAPVAGSQLGVKHGPPSEETRAKMSAAKLGHEVSKETRAKIRATLMGRKLPEEQKAKISASLMGHEVSKETRAKIGCCGCSDETRAKISAAMKGKPWSKARRAAEEKRKELK